MTSLTVIGRRWFQRTYGNTYNTAQVIVDGETVVKTPRQYGYGDHYLDLAADALEDLGLMPNRERYSHGGAESLWRWAERNGIKFTSSAIDVPREKDL